MPANQIVHNTGGQNRFLDYVSLLPEFLRSEPDVVTLMQIFSDYLNNAYRNVEAATKYEFRLVAVEGMVGTVTAQLQKLADIFVQCANKEVPCLYMYLPTNPASGIIEYAGTNPMVQLTTSIIPGGGSTNDRFYIDCVSLPEQSGVYVVTNVATSDGHYQLALDSDGFSQDPFTKTADKPILTPAGYAPRMLEFYPSDISEIGSRRAEVTENDVIYYEVYFSATITGITDVPSILSEVTTNAGIEFPYLVDYYDHLGGFFPPQFTGGLFTVEFSPSVSCSPFANGRGIFYARDLTAIDKQPRYLDPQGNNIYSDPEFLYRVKDPTQLVNLSNPPIPDLTQLNYTSDRNSNINFLKIHCSYVENSGSISSGSYVVRLVVGAKSSSFDMSTVSTTTGAIVLTTPTTLKIGDTVQFVGTGTIPTGIVNDSTHIISSISSDGLNIYFSGVAFTSAGSGTGTINSITRTGDSVGVVSSFTSGVITYSSFIGNMITAGQFGIITGNQIVSRIEVTLPDGTNPIYIWSDTAHAYRAGSYIYYGCVYRVVRDTTFVNGTPDSESSYYVSDMTGITTYGTETVYNPYMFGGYQGRNLAYTKSIDYNAEDFSTLGNEIIVQPGEQSGIAFRYPQREWIFNPTTANVRNLDRNGWIEVYSLYSPSNSDIANSASTQFILTPSSIRANGRRVIFTFPVNHGYSVGQYVKISGTTTYPILGTYPIILISDSKTIVVECTSSIVSSDTIITDALTVTNPNTVGNGTVMFAKQNLFDISTLNPAYSEAGTWYMYTLNTVALSRYTTFNPALYSNVLSVFPSDSGTYNISSLYGEQTVLCSTGNLSLKDGDLVLLQDQLSTDQNGYWRVKANESWSRIGTKLVMKVTDILVDAIEVGDLYNSDSPYYYNRYSDSYVTATIAAQKNVFAEQASQIQNYSLMMPSIDGIDTTTPLHKIYDARYDSNSVSVVPEFTGVPDMGYPIVEKIERLVYQKDPNVIDYSLIAYLARYMGYDITPVADDVMSSQFYTSEEVRETAIRKVIQRLPEFNALKATEKGLEVLLLTFGIVGEVIKMWTDLKNPYGEFIPDYNVMDYRYTNMRDGIAPILHPTPHFLVQIEVEGNFPNELGIAEIGRLGTGIMKYKPINTVFEGIQAYMKLTAESSIYMSAMNARGKIQADIGFDVSFDEIIEAAPSIWNPPTVSSNAYLISLAPANISINVGGNITLVPIFSDGNSYSCNWSVTGTSVTISSTVGNTVIATAVGSGNSSVTCHYGSDDYSVSIGILPQYGTSWSVTSGMSESTGLDASTDGAFIVSTSWDHTAHISRNSGTTWADDSSVPGSNYAYGAFTTNTGRILIPSFSNGIEYSDDYTTWTHSGSFSYVSCIAQLRNNTLIATTYNGTNLLYTSTDNGTTWVPQSVFGDYTCIMQLPNGNVVILGNSVCSISNNNGDSGSWVSHSFSYNVGTQGYAMTQGCLARNGDLLIPSGSNYILRSSDGITWTQITMPGDALSIFKEASGRVLVGGVFSNDVMYSDDSGNATYALATSTATVGSSLDAIIRMIQIPSGEMFAVSASGKIYKSLS